MNKNLLFLFVSLCLPLLGLAQPSQAAGEVWAWGWNEYGQLGDGTLTNKSTPVRVNNLGAVEAVAGGFALTSSLKSDGSVWAWGEDQGGILANKPQPVQVSGLTNIIAMTCGYLDNFALRSDGTVWAWGHRDSGQLPTLVTGLSDIKSISAGSFHVLALKSDGTVWSWGQNTHGQLGDGTTTDRSFPAQVLGLSNVTSISSGYDHSMAVRSDGTVWGWGYNSHGQLGDGTLSLGSPLGKTTPVQAKGISGVKAIAAGHSHTLALKNDGSVWSWGDGQGGVLGNGPGDSELRPTPAPVIGLSNIQAIAAYGNSVALTSDGRVYTWGWNNYGQLGDGTKNNQSTPTVVNGLSGINYISVGYGHTLAIKTVPTAPSAALIITGRVANHSGTGMAGITIIRNGGYTVTDANGNYTLRNVPQGIYTIAPQITPSLSGVTLYPASRSVTVNTSSLSNISFTASFTVTGRIANHSGTGIPNIQVKRVQGASTVSTFTDAGGNYRFTNVRSGSYTVSPVLTPSMSGMSFTPTATNITVDRSNLTNINFIGMFSISGRVTSSAGAGIANAQIKRAAGSSVVSVFTDANGNYTFGGVRSGSYTLTPVLRGKTLSPASRSITVGTLSLTNQNFIGAG